MRACLKGVVDNLLSNTDEVFVLGGRVEYLYRKTMSGYRVKDYGMGDQ